MSWNHQPPHLACKTHIWPFRHDLWYKCEKIDKDKVVLKKKHNYLLHSLLRSSACNPPTHPRWPPNHWPRTPCKSRTCSWFVDPMSTILHKTNNKQIIQWRMTFLELRINRFVVTGDADSCQVGHGIVLGNEIAFLADQPSGLYAIVHTSSNKQQATTSFTMWYPHRSSCIYPTLSGFQMFQPKMVE